jgi:hypothetical protein
MKHIRKINEFINESEIYSLIEKVENECKYLSDIQLSLEGHSRSIKINPASFGKGREFDVEFRKQLIN